MAVYMPTATHEIKPTKHENDSKALTGDVLDANGHVIVKAGGGAPNPNRNNKKSKLKWGNPKSTPTYGVFSDHGQRKLHNS